jgi:two-component system OmpR family response regulator
MRILVAEDSARIAAQLRTALVDFGHAVDVATDGEQALHLGRTERYDAVILDLGLPRVDGLSVLRQWRAAGLAMPVLILTARGSWADKVSGLNAGADDYLAKPFVIDELVARIAALIRRAHGHARPVLECGSLRIDTVSMEVIQGGVAVRLTALEYALLVVLAHRRGQLLSKADLTVHLYDQSFDRDSNTLEVIISRLRRKLGSDVIETQRGKGYRLLVQDAA